MGYLQLPGGPRDHPMAPGSYPKVLPKPSWSPSERFLGLSRGPRNALPKPAASLRLAVCQQQARTDKLTVNSQQLPATYHKLPVTRQQ